MNVVIMRLTLRALLGSRRVWILVGMAALLWIVAGLSRWGSGADVGTATGVIVNFGFGTLVPIMCLLVGTGAVAPEIEDGSIVYLLAKPVPRRTVVLSKLIVAMAVAVAFSVISIVVAAQIAGDAEGQLALSMGVASALASIAYVAVFFMIGVVSRNSIIVGLIYAMLWEGTLAGYVPGVRAVSVRQWALAPAEQIVEDNSVISIASDLPLVPAIVLLVLATVVSTIVSVQRLKVLSARVSE